MVRGFQDFFGWALSQVRSRIVTRRRRSSAAGASGDLGLPEEMDALFQGGADAEGLGLW